MPAAEIETAVIGQVRGLMQAPEIIVATWRNTREQESGITEAEVRVALQDLNPLDPETFNFLPVWYPEHARQALFYKANWSEPQMNTNWQTGISIHKSKGNVHANKALTLALGYDHPSCSPVQFRFELTEILN